MRKRALLIGVDDYPYLGNLQFAQCDAKGVADSLRRNYSFDISEICLMTGREGLFAPSLTNIETQLNDIKNRFRNLDFFLVGFWGHGYLSPDQSSRYLCLSDSHAENLDKTSLTYDFLTSYLKMICAQNTCLILDCCQTIGVRGNPAQIAESESAHLGELSESMARDIKASREHQGYSVFIPPNFAILNSCMPNQQSYELRDRRHGLFTAHLLDGMEKKLESVGRWSSYVSRHVTAEASATGRNQTPIFKQSGSGDIELVELIPSGPAEPRPVEPGPKVVISVDPTQVQIQSYPVEEIQIEIEYEKITSSAEAAPTSEKVVLPAIPTDLRKLQGELAGIEKLLEEVAAETASVLRPAQESIELARQQRNQIAQRQSELLKNLNLSSADRRQLETVINDKMNPTVSPLSLRSGKPESMKIEDFIPVVLWQQKKMQSEAIVRKTEVEYKEKRTELIEKLHQQKKDNLAHQQTATTAFYEQVIDLVLSVCPGYAKAESPVPFEELVPLLPVLYQYHLGWSDDIIWDEAEKRWKDNRPCVIKEKERLEREKAEQERQRLERGKAEQERQRLEELRKSREGDKAGERRVETISGVEYAFRWCPAGTFLMGSPKDEKERFDDERQHKVTLTRGFWLLETPVTQLMWKSVMGNNPSYYNGDNRPVEQVNWKDCTKFIGKLNGLFDSPLRFRLPTEAEWEYACRARTTTAYSFGICLNGDQANCDGNRPYGTETKGPYLGKTTPVKTYSPNVWGLYDMHGNVREWCEDWKGDYPSGEVTDPRGPNSGSDRGGRGGSWRSGALGCRSAFRGGDGPELRSASVGFRLALSSTR